MPYLPLTMTPDTDRAWTLRPRFLDLNGRRLFALELLPQRPCIGAVLYLPAFAEEMNRFRSHVSAQARVLAGLGYHCLLLDPHGTGESDGEIVEGDWSHWVADGVAAGRWLQDQAGQPLTLWGARSGALLAADVAAAPDTPAIDGLLLWQPVLDGKLFMNQYLRLRIASQLVKDTERETTETIRARLAAGEVLEVAGYPLTGGMAAALAAGRLDRWQPGAGQRVRWVEIVAKPGQDLALPSRRLADQWQAAGASVQVAAVACPMVWQVHERVDAPPLQQATTALMEPAR